MSFKVPESKASIKQNQFEFELPGSRRKYRLPKMQYITNGLKDPLLETIKDAAQYMDENGKPGEDFPPELSAEFNRLTSRILEHHCPGVWDQLDQEQGIALINEWQRASRTDLGKS